ncbi:DUF1800 domain-containing protein [Sediminibacterium salmoneum]|uniref:DUF1800 domain-containing protein n=1 Tax=Sediminibacterium salmoneum TaxID=426421 RepID=UPI0004798DFF|nr:DUF1800 domain-containing protein [Sediminibacterium salmoneum]
MKFARPFCGWLGLFFLLVFSAKAADEIPYKKYGYTPAQAAARLIDRFSFGAKPGQVAAVVAMGIDNWFEQQLEGNQPNAALDKRLANFKSLQLNNDSIVNRYLNAGQVIRLATRNGLLNRDSIQADQAAYRAQVRQLMEQQGYLPIQELHRELVVQKVLRAAYSNNQLQEVLTDFWFNHFNVSATKNQCQQFIYTYERDAIRPNVLGSFKDLLLATAKHPAMLEYLDNASSVSLRNAPRMYNNAPRNARGLNENYAREVMELHTLGVDGGYTQADVTAVARALTGWTVMQGNFLFRPRMHDNEAKTILNKNFPANGGYQEGIDVLTMLAEHPSTAQFICTKLATRFVSDTPSASLIKNMVKTFQSTGGNIKEVLRTMVHDPSFWKKSAPHEKVKSPFELVISAVRATNAQIVQPFQLFNWCTKMGQRFYYYQAPTGFPDRASYWINTGSLLNRMNFGLAFASQKIPGVRMDLAALNNYHEPESAIDALNVYSNLLLPQRDHSANIKRLIPLVNDEAVEEKINKASDLSANKQGETMMDLNKTNPAEEKISLEKGSKTLLSQVVGIIIGSPEFQRK